jgi:hypothetical protein
MLAYRVAHISVQQPPPDGALSFFSEYATPWFSMTLIADAVRRSPLVLELFSPMTAETCKGRDGGETLSTWHGASCRGSSAHSPPYLGCSCCFQALPLYRLVDGLPSFPESTCCGRFRGRRVRRQHGGRGLRAILWWSLHLRRDVAPVGVVCHGV